MGNGAEVVVIEEKPEEATSSLDWCNANVEASKKKEGVEISGEIQATMFCFFTKTFLKDLMIKYYDCLDAFFIYQRRH